MKIVVRAETRSDFEDISQLNDLAFGRESEGRLIINLRKKPEFRKELSLVALFENQVVGHILLSPVKIRNGERSFETLALAPLCVMPELQGFGIGGLLVESALKAGASLGFGSVMVVGDPGYYRRFGFITAGQYQITTSLQAEEEYFMALELTPGGLQGVSGCIEYPAEFDEVS